MGNCPPKWIPTGTQQKLTEEYKKSNKTITHETQNLQPRAFEQNPHENEIQQMTGIIH